MSVSANQSSLELGRTEKKMDSPEFIFMPPPSLETAQVEKESQKQVEQVLEDEGCRTPTSQEHRIPHIHEPPPAPQKPRPVPRPCKRKLFNIDPHEIDYFFETHVRVCRKIKKHRVCEKL